MGGEVGRVGWQGFGTEVEMPGREVGRVGWEGLGREVGMVGWKGLTSQTAPTKPS